jgi:hypothetical protein
MTVAARAIEASGLPPMDPRPGCGCRACSVEMYDDRMYCCAECGNKRCPHATDHRLACTGSNDIGQLGSVYGEPLPPAPEPP